eukprot:CAMPEP_0175958904 /NCGR_PEP_ID=MMETSP0108-20121206/34506_1 /TAXON_ID=195067 ORGANISM="Goniomonas pacifica, Strain CCMP1869" /NCGR_SAMPLE_ID=MMETSP0108 /ASSEMBLY_ACC=CAM_ASM_000204 /LENGTH=197 /DNA_ID=CAMNT_0017286309 /DNA_START=43 /DNA_END=634 /DNA_ORIENTATION=+
MPRLSLTADDAIRLRFSADVASEANAEAGFALGAEAGRVVGRRCCRAPDREESACIVACNFRRAERVEESRNGSSKLSWSAEPALSSPQGVWTPDPDVTWSVKRRIKGENRSLQLNHAWSQDHQDTVAFQLLTRRYPHRPTHSLPLASPLDLRGAGPRGDAQARAVGFGGVGRVWASATAAACCTASRALSTSAVRR